MIRVGFMKEEASREEFYGQSLKLGLVRQDISATSCSILSLSVLISSGKIFFSRLNFIIPIYRHSSVQH